MDDVHILSDLEQNRDLISESQYYKNFKFKIEKLMDFLDSLSTLIFENGKIITCISGTKMHILQTELIDSAIRTLVSIKSCCIYGNFSDANALTRKYRDDLILFLFILGVLNNRQYLSEEQIREAVGDGIDIDKWITIIELTINIAVSGNAKNCNDRCVDAWFDDNVNNLTWSQKRNLSFENYMTYLKTNASINEIIVNYNLEKNWEKIRQKLNDYTHNNGRTYTRHNLITINSPDVKNCFKEITSRLEFITSVFVVFLILIDSTFIGSTDYVDHLDMDVEPPEDSQYWIAPFIHEFIDKYINTINPELKMFLKLNNKYGMLID
ncbi:hypothetical protein L9W92_04675 [Pelotomaculum terephthalicicum JT]|uniref:hypothetical protein n=1 Tax=Pelotomaculum terephthalicicum TaxID=206393 RepID=UPI001F04DC93|nr:hypothetical protein [Pelotomaculum terephthalicicum]MCG9967351.1 hypothetical protein [Pelotomaculum terephthalicicum JT]